MSSGLLLVARCCSRYSFKITAAATASTEALAGLLPAFERVFASCKTLPDCSSSKRSASQLVRRSSSMSTGRFSCLRRCARGRNQRLQLIRPYFLLRDAVSVWPFLLYVLRPLVPFCQGSQ